jgi:signal transduction histidine kinase/HAMP domain-containing protein
MRNSTRAIGSNNAVAEFARVANQAAEKTFHLRRLNIGPRLTLGFAFIILATLAGTAVLLWQFHLVRVQSERLSGVDQELIAVLQVHTNLMSLYERLDALAQSKNAAGLLTEAESLRDTLLEDTQRSRNALSRLPSEVQLEPTLLPTLEAIQGNLPPQLDAITALAKSGDWEAVRLRLANEVRPLESRTSALVQSVDLEVGEERAQALLNIGQAQQRILLTVPIIAALTLLIAALLGFAIRRSITQPLGQLMQGSKALARGEFQHQVSVIGNDELAHLGRVCNDTAGTLRELYHTLRSKEAYLEEAQRLSHTGSFGWNVSTGELVWSDETFRIFEYSRTAKPSIELVLERTHPEDLASVRQLIDLVSRGGMAWDLEHRLLMPDGSVRYVRAVAHPVTDSSGQLEFVGAVLDVTAGKQAEEVLRQAQATLAHVTRVTTLGEMAASIAHEVNQPIAAAITNSNTCLRWLTREPPDLEEARDAASRIVKDARRAADIISRIRFLFQKGASQQEAVDVNEVIREMIVLLRNEADRYSVSIRTDLVRDLPEVMADRVQLQQVLMNLMHNGIEAIKDTNSAGELRITSERVDDGHLLISVSDTGVGLAPQQTDQIFEAFYTTKPEGTGMGLAISRSIIESHGGRLWATANSGPGAAFHFTLPTQVEAGAANRRERQTDHKLSRDGAE